MYFGGNNMVLNVFFSHSTGVEDSWIVDSVENYYRSNPQFGVDIYIAERYPEPGRSISEKIMERIRESDCVLFLLTKNGTYSQWVAREYQSALENRKPIVPLVEKDVEKEAKSFLGDREYVTFDRDNPRDTFSWLVQYLDSLKGQKERDELIQGLIVGGLFILGLFALSKILGKKG